MNYDSFIQSKAINAPATGIARPPKLNPKLFGFQSDLVSWALRRGRSAIFADTGTGKGWMILEWARVVSIETGLPVLVLAPLAVARQFEREAAALGSFDGLPRVGFRICNSQADAGPGINVTNYQKLHKFEPEAFGGVALDESSILKSLDGKTRAQLCDAFKETRFKLCATATPSPNDHTELGGHTDFLGIMTQSEMLATFFVHDGGSTQDWRIKGHAREDFWRWVCSWGAIVKMPSDIGGDDSGYELPPLNYHEHIVPATTEDAKASGMLFAAQASNMGEERAARRGTLGSRVRLASDIANATDGQAIVWCDLNDESAALASTINGAVEVTGSQSDDEKESRIEQFLRGERRVLVSKPSICGFGLNLQQVNSVVFCGVTHSFEAFYQAVRRCWRFGQKNAVDVHIVSSELEGRVVHNLKAKQRKADELASETRALVAGHVRTAVSAQARETLAYNPTHAVRWPKWLKTEEVA